MMKRMVCLLSLCLLFSIGSSQENSRKYFNKSKLGALIRVETQPTNSKKQSGGTEITTVNGLFINTNMSVGIGLSLSSHVNPAITYYPIFLSYNFYYKRKINTPYTGLNVGYSIMPKGYRKNLFYEMEIGWNFKIGKNNAIHPEISYRHQGYEDVFKRHRAINSIGLGLGFLF